MPVVVEEKNICSMDWLRNTQHAAYGNNYRYFGLYM